MMYVLLGHSMLVINTKCWQSRASLDQDALLLWIAALRNASTFSNSNTEPSLLELLPIAVELLADNLDLLGSITSILESYFVLDAVAVVQVSAHTEMVVEVAVTVAGCW